MENKDVEQKLNEVTEVKTMLSELKAFIFGKEEKKEEVKKEEVKPETEVKAEFNHEEFTKTFNEYKTSIEDKFKSSDEKLSAFEAQIKTANETISKQDEQLKKMFALIEKALETPVKATTQKPKEGTVKSTSTGISKEELEAFRKQHNL